VVKSRSVLVLVFALAVAVAQVSGLHFHLPESHHDAATEHVHSDHHPSTSSLLAGLTSEHLSDHMAGAQDAEASATLIGAKLMTVLLTCVLAVFGMAFFLVRIAGTGLPVWPPLRPPRQRNPVEFLPPSRGPPLAA